MTGELRRENGVNNLREMRWWERHFCVDFELEAVCFGDG
jgi:hypothetical protein